LVFLDPAAIVPGSREARTGFRGLLPGAGRQQEYAIPYPLLAHIHLLQLALSAPQELGITQLKFGKGALGLILILIREHHRDKAWDGGDWFAGSERLR